MDIVLEILDTLVLDRAYSTLLPASPSAYLTQKFNNATTSTFSSLREGATPTPQYKYIFEPASRILSLNPTEWAYKSSWPRDNIYRQFISLFAIVWCFGLILYFACASLSYVFIFDKSLKQHPKYLKNQVRLEIIQANKSMPGMAILTALCMLAEVRGHAKLYDLPSEAPFSWYNYLQFPFFLLFTDCGIYWIHRGLHHPWVYKRLHKPHHKWVMPTPYASHAFHPIDGFAQSVPYHLYPFLFPLQKFAYIALFVFINVWTIFIHDGEFYANNSIINGAACHAYHHLYFNYNFGQFTTIWDRLGGSYRRPEGELFDKETKMSKMQKISKEVDGANAQKYRKDVKESKKAQ